ncbi:UNVERIFIED_ORG: hypothetical protein J2W85_004248 [Ensifer adhaerens]|nr:hypothetical protein [Ensifer adhaerens]
MAISCRAGRAPLAMSLPIAATCFFASVSETKQPHAKVIQDLGKQLSASNRIPQNLRLRFALNV